MDLMIIALVALAAIVLIPVLVVGTWGLIVYGIVGTVDGAIWLLERRWRHPQGPAAEISSVISAGSAGVRWSAATR